MGIQIRNDDSASNNSRLSSPRSSVGRFTGIQHTLKINRDILGQRASFGGIYKKVSSPDLSSGEVAGNLTISAKKMGTRIEPYGGTRLSNLPQGAYTDRSNQNRDQSATRFSVKEGAKKRYISPQR